VSTGERSLYEVLGVPPHASAEEIRAAYRRAARRHHPDAGGDPRRMSDLNAAWRVLGDPVRRARYDRELAARPARPAGPPPAAGPPPGAGVGPDLLADLLDDRPLRPTRPLEGWWAMLPPATLVAACLALAGAFVFTAPGLLALFGGLLVLSLGLFVLAPLRAMTRRDDP